MDVDGTEGFGVCDVLGVKLVEEEVEGRGSSGGGSTGPFNVSSGEWPSGWEVCKGKSGGMLSLSCEG